MPTDKIKILFIGAELDPLIKVGGLGDVIGSLPRALVKMSVEVKIIIPYYGSISGSKYKIKLFKKNIRLELSDGYTSFDLYQCFLPSTSIKVFLIRHQVFKSREVYVGARKYLSNKAYSRGHSDIERFVLFSKAAVTSLAYINWRPDLIHCHDWHTALVPTFIDEASLHNKNFSNIRTLFTIHNLANQGLTPLDMVDYADLDKEQTPAMMEDYYDNDNQHLSLMKIGILSADFINTVSPSYAQEILSKEYGAGLEKYLQRRQRHLRGIINGIDQNFFNPLTDKFIYKKYSPATVKIGKEINKKFLQEELGLEISQQKPLLALVSRLVRQKGLDILWPAMEKTLKSGQAQFVILGSGQKEYEHALINLAKKYKKSLVVKIGFDMALAQKIYAASDFFLMPSLFEPCGLGQMMAMRYGSIPLVRKTGGLQDTVSEQNGIIFKNYSATALRQALDKAVRLYQQPGKFKLRREQGLKFDSSWSKSAKEYIKIYKKLA